MTDHAGYSIPSTPENKIIKIILVLLMVVLALLVLILVLVNRQSEVRASQELQNTTKQCQLLSEQKKQELKKEVDTVVKENKQLIEEAKSWPQYKQELVAKFQPIFLDNVRKEFGWDDTIQQLGLLLSVVKGIEATNELEILSQHKPDLIATKSKKNVSLTMEIAEKEGFDYEDRVTYVGIAYAESSMVSTAHNKHSDDAGLVQVNIPIHYPHLTEEERSKLTTEKEIEEAIKQKKDAFRQKMFIPEENLRFGCKLAKGRLNANGRMNFDDWSASRYKWKYFREAYFILMIKQADRERDQLSNSNIVNELLAASQR